MISTVDALFLRIFLGVIAVFTIINALFTLHWVWIVASVLSLVANWQVDLLMEA